MVVIEDISHGIWQNDFFFLFLTYHKTNVKQRDNEVYFPFKLDPYINYVRTYNFFRIKYNVDMGKTTTNWRHELYMHYFIEFHVLHAYTISWHDNLKVWVPMACFSETFKIHGAATYW